ncbi:MAG TPA: Crp/Fnr family transcriptional regulator [Sphingomicrobium sp.]
MLAKVASPLESFVARLERLSPVLPEDRLALLRLGGEIIQAPAGVDIVVPGEDVEYIHLLIEGLLARFAQFSDGKRQITAIHIPGDMADLHSVATPSVGSPIQALATSTLIRFPIHELRSLVRARPSVAEAFWAYSAVDTAVLTRWAANLGRRAAAHRMAHLLCEIGMRMEAAGRGDRLRFTLNMTQPQLGDALGLTSVHVNRTLKALRTLQLVTISGRDFTVLDWPRLAALGEFDCSYLLIEEPTLRAA